MVFYASSRRGKVAAWARAQCWSPGRIRRDPYMETAMTDYQNPDKGKREPCAGTVSTQSVRALQKVGSTSGQRQEQMNRVPKRWWSSMDVRVQPG